MALIIDKQPDVLTAGYSEMEIEAHDSVNTVVYYNVAIDVGGDITNLMVLPTYADNHLNIDISSVINGYLESQIVHHTDSFNILSVLAYNVTITAVNASTSVSLATTNKYCLNATVQEYETFNYVDYMYDTTKSTYGKTLTIGNKSMVKGQYFTFQYLEGVFGTYTSKRTALNLVAYNKTGGVISTTAISTPIYSSTPKIISLAVELDVENAAYYKITGSIVADEIVITMLNEDSRFNTKQLAYVNSLGTTSYFNFTQNNENSYKIDREDYLNQYNKYTGYNTEVEHSVKVYSHVLSFSDMVALKELYYSPKTAHIDNNVVKDIIISDKKYSETSRISSDVKIVDLEFMYANKYTVQTR